MGSLTVAYNGNTIHTSTETETFTLPTAGKYMATDITITADSVDSYSVSYNGSNIINAQTASKTIKCGGKVMASNLGFDVTIGSTPTTEYFITFSSPSAFTIAKGDGVKRWDGTLEYSTNKTTWTEWSASQTIYSETTGGKDYIYMRGVGNTKIGNSSSSSGKWVLTGNNISCTGDIETLLDYSTVANGAHPTCGNYTFAYIFYGNHSLIEAPRLTSVSFGIWAFTGMFTNTNISNLPLFHATTLTQYCYYQTFYNCPNIKLSTVRTGEYQTEYRIPSSGTGTSATGALSGMFGATGGSFTGTPTINTTYYTSNTVI